MRNGNGSGNISMSLRRVMSHRAWGEVSVVVDTQVQKTCVHSSKTSYFVFLVCEFMFTCPLDYPGPRDFLSLREE